MTANKQPPLTIKCPECGKPVAWIPDSLYKPFCSERCKLIDLGEWAMGGKAIPGESVAQENNDDDLAFFQ